MPAPSKPNILLIIVDQARRDAFGCYGSRICRTPSVDSIAEHGIRFDSAYTTISLCSPARASMFTGLLPHRHGMLYNMTGASYGRNTLVPGTKLISHYLKKAGYRCGYAGKWHIDKHGPAGHGFEGTTCPGFGLPNDFVDEYEGFLTANGHPGCASITVKDYTTPEGSRDAHLPLPYGIDGIIQLPVELTPAGFVASKTIELLKAMRDKPFCITASFWGPHHPALPNEEYAYLYPPEDIPPWENFNDELAGKPRIQKRYRHCLHRNFNGAPWSVWAKTVSRHHAFLTMIDAQIGKILESLNTLGLADNTVVIFTSDHGDTLGCHGGQFDKGPYMYEETYRVPLVVRFPGGLAPHASAGRHVSTLVSNMDIFPTILDLAGAEIPEKLDAVSFAGVAHDPAVRFREHLVAQFNGFDTRGMYLQRMIRHGQYKYVFNPGDYDELYDLEQDPHELHNRISEHGMSGIRHELQTRLAEEMKRCGDPHARHIDDFLEQ